MSRGEEGMGGQRRNVRRRSQSSGPVRRRGLLIYCEFPKSCPFRKFYFS